MKQTPLYTTHVAHGAKLVDFAGWQMPLHYSGVLDEYHTVRHHAGLFDVSHMGRIGVEGQDSLGFLQWMTTNNVEKAEVLGSQYSMMCNPNGGVLDDIFVYRLGQREFLLCVNSSNVKKILEWVNESHTPSFGECHILDRSEKVAQLALQGPASRRILEESVGDVIRALKPRHCLSAKVNDMPLLITRTGYTGEVGYELYVPSDHVVSVWNVLIEKGDHWGIKPAGLGARDLLRLDMGYFLYGNDLTEETTPIEAGASWVVDFDKGDFIGRSVLAQQRAEGMLRQLVAFELVEKGVPRHGMRLFSEDQEVGQVTSGNLSPILQKGIGLGYVLPSFAQIGTSIQVDIRGRRIPAIVVKPPFYKRPKNSQVVDKST